MKILYVELNLQGHREKYLKQLLKINELDNSEYKIYLLLSNNDGINDIYKFDHKSGFDKKRTIITYLKFIKQIRKIVRDYDIDVVHFLCGDALYRYFGIGLSSIGCKIVITCHHVELTKIKKISIKRIFQKSNAGIVHTEELYKKLKKEKFENVYVIDYPMLDLISKKSAEEAKKYFKLPEDILVIGCIDGTPEYKGIDFLIQALNDVQKEMCLFVTGKNKWEKEDYINNKITNKKIIIKSCFRFLSEEEFADAIQASDIIMLPYRKEFDGASGILIESVFHNKHVIASNHGSMGSLVKKYKLGRTFETDDLDDLINTINEDIEKPFKLTSKIEEYRKKLSTDIFMKNYDTIYKIIEKEK